MLWPWECWVVVILDYCNSASLFCPMSDSMTVSTMCICCLRPWIGPTSVSTNVCSVPGYMTFILPPVLCGTSCSWGCMVYGAWVALNFSVLIAYLMEFIMTFNTNSKWPGDVAVALVFKHIILLLMWFQMFGTFSGVSVLRKASPNNF